MVQLFSNDITRRSFLQLTAAATAAAALVERPALGHAADDGEKVFDACCPSLALCTAVCPLKVTVKGGRITHIASHPEYKSCPKGLAQRMNVYDPDRLKYPLKRVGERGEAKFERISWDEAIDLYAGKIKEISGKYGNTAILWYPARGTGGLARAAAKLRFPNVFGGMVTVWGSLCIANKMLAAPTIFGIMNSESDLETIKDSKLAVIWGYGFADSNRRTDFAGE
ncbi:MAG TPA: molybdopterin-dependent oxidoreductase, partial [Candidatus Sulfotelmatobacter sp.]|nr:molybdopterin-dependent oxidoreductase [Candidatus Sulfotelmatobacter sp.]